MNFFHCPIKIVSRNKGRSAVASAAYISGTRLENTWDGTTHDYTRKQHIIHSEIMLPVNAPPQYMDRATLWNSVEWNETDRNAQLARVFEIALPAELTHEQNITLARKIVQDLFVSKGMCADFGVHDKKDGNPHVHIMLTMRAFQEDGRWAPKSKLVYNLDADGNRIPAKQKGRWKTHKENYVDWDNRGNAELWRAEIADHINDALREAGFTQGFVDHRSYARQGVERIPMKHEGPDARAMEKRGIRTEVGDLNRDIRAQNKLLEQLEARLTKLNSYAMYEKKLDEELIAQGKDVSDPNLRFILASQIFNAGKPENKHDHRLRDASGLLVIMKQYEITDAASYAAAVKKVNTRFYELRSKRKENYDLSIELSARITAYEERKKYQRYYKAWEKLPEQKRPAFEKQYAFELRKYREAEAALQRWQDNGEQIDYKGWQKALKYLNTERMVLDIDLREMKEDVRRLEVVKREYIKENKKIMPDRYGR